MEKLGEDQSSLSSIASFIPTPLAEPPANAAHRKPATPPSPASPGSDETEDDGEERLSCSLSGCELTVRHWSVHWTAGSVRSLLLAPLGGTHVVFCEEGAAARLYFTTTIAAQQARRVVEAACAMVNADAELDTDASPAGSVSSSVDGDESEEHPAHAYRAEAGEEEAACAALFAPQHPGGVLSSGGPRLLSPPCSLSIEAPLALGRFSCDLMAPSSHGWSCLASC